MTATIYDVATRAGVSIATVSRVLNAPQSVNSMTRARVQTVIDDLGFIPKAEATARARRRHRQVGVLVPFFTYSSFVQRLRGIAAALLDAGLELVVYNAETPEHVRAYLLSLPVTRRLDGLIIISLRIDQQASRRLVEHNLPAVLIETPSSDFSCVDIDNRAGGVLAAEHLLEQGHRRIGFVGGDREIAGYTWRTSELRLEGFRDRLAQAGAGTACGRYCRRYGQPRRSAPPSPLLVRSRRAADRDLCRQRYIGSRRVAGGARTQCAGAR